MYVSTKVVVDKFDLFAYIEDNNDTFNSKFLYKLGNAGKYRYKVTENEDRVDLIARQIYGSDGDRYYPILIMLNNKFKFNKDEIIYYVDIDTINSILRKL